MRDHVLGKYPRHVIDFADEYAAPPTFLEDFRLKKHDFHVPPRVNDLRLTFGFVEEVVLGVVVVVGVRDRSEVMEVFPAWLVGWCGCIGVMGSTHGIQTQNGCLLCDVSSIGVFL